MCTFHFPHTGEQFWSDSNTWVQNVVVERKWDLKPEKTVCKCWISYIATLRTWVSLLTSLRSCFLLWKDTLSSYLDDYMTKNVSWPLQDRCFINMRYLKNSFLSYLHFDLCLCSGDRLPFVEWAGHMLDYPFYEKDNSSKASSQMVK